MRRWIIGTSVLVGVTIFLWYFDQRSVRPDVLVGLSMIEEPVEPISKLLEKMRDNSIRIIGSGWYNTEASGSVLFFYTVKSLLVSNDDKGLREQRACLENILVKLAAESGDLKWASYSPDGSHKKAPRPSTKGRLFTGVSKIACVMKQRVYAEVTDQFVNVLKDKGRFGEDKPTSEHEESLKAFLRDGVIDDKQYDISFTSWRENRRYGSLQCVVATLKSESGSVNRYFADIDIDKSHPWGDVVTAFGHLLQIFFGTNHVKLQRKDHFLEQNECEVGRYLGWLRKNSMGTSLLQ